MSRRGPVIGMPFKSASPSVCGSSPAKIFSNVDLPQPDGPTTAMNSPSAIEEEMLLRASTPAAPRPYLSDSPRTEMTEPGEAGCVISAWAFKRPSGVVGAEFWRWHRVKDFPQGVAFGKPIHP